jgi:hypothetical protein
MAARLRTLLVAALLLIFSSAAAATAAADDSNSVCTANDTREECSAPAGDDNATGEEEDEEDIPATCVDEHEDCRMWSDQGECDKNPNCEYVSLSCISNLASSFPTTESTYSCKTFFFTYL